MLDALPQDVLFLLLDYLEDVDVLSLTSVNQILKSSSREDFVWGPRIRRATGASTWACGVRAPLCRVLRDPQLCGSVPLWLITCLVPPECPHALRLPPAVDLVEPAGRLGAGGAAAGVARVAPVGQELSVSMVAANHAFPSFPSPAGAAATLPWAWAPPVSRAQLEACGANAGDLRTAGDSALFAGAYIVAYYEVTIHAACEAGGAAGEEAAGPRGGGGGGRPPYVPTVAVGLASRAFLESSNRGTSDMLGWKELSCGYHGDDGRFFHNSVQGIAYGPRFGAGDTVGCGVVYAGALRRSAHLRGSLFDPAAERDSDFLSPQTPRRPGGGGGGGARAPFAAPPSPPSFSAAEGGAPPAPHPEPPGCPPWETLAPPLAAARWPHGADSLFFTRNGALLGPAPLPAQAPDFAGAPWTPCVGFDAPVTLSFNFGAEPGRPFAFDVRGFNGALLLRHFAPALPPLPRVPRAVRVEVARESSAQVLSAARLTMSPPPPPALRAGGGGAERPSPPHGGGASPPSPPSPARAPAEAAASILAEGGGRDAPPIQLLRHAMRGRQLLLACARLRRAGVEALGREEGAGRLSPPPPLTPARCAACKQGGAALECSRCGGARYCSPQCQEVHWPSHKRACGEGAGTGTGAVV
jgi:hypothetical protein